MKCSRCGTLTNEFKIIDHEVWCEDCIQEEGLVQCQDCGEWFCEEKGYSYDGEPLCEKCYENDYYTCDECGEIVRSDDIVHIEDKDIFVCENCADNKYYHCNDCGHWVADATEIHNGDYVCDDCLNRSYRQCDDCGEWFYNDEIEWDEDREEYFCQDCYDKIDRPILSYHQDYEWDYLTLDGEDKKYFGFELEVSGDRDYAQEFKDCFSDELVLMNDSSIDDGGFEIVTFPMTREYFYSRFIHHLSDGLSFLRRHGFSSHNKGGLHIHISEDFIDKDMLAQLRSILYGSEQDKNTWLQITQRHHSNMNQWSSMDTSTTFEDIKEERNYYKKISTGRYTALNYDDRTKTYEFRIFNGNIRLERFLKNFETVLALLDYVKENKDAETPVCTTLGFLQYVAAHKEKYLNLYSFIIDRKILVQHEENNYNQELLEVA